MKTNLTALEFSNHLMMAQTDAKEAGINEEDGGACNFDTVVLKTNGIPTKKKNSHARKNSILTFSIVLKKNH